MDSLIIFGAKYLFIFVVVLALAAWLQANWKIKKQMLLAGVLAGLMAAIFDKIFSHLYYDPRPFVTHQLQPLVAHAADNGFPSEHTLFSIALATVIFFYRPRIGIAAGVIALIVGVSRVAAHVHSPIDILAGVILGIASGYLGYYLARKILA
jgi:undecaprenyl-diphosphatase